MEATMRSPSNELLPPTAQISSYEDYEHLKAKQRASVLWLMSKAYNNRIPGDLKEPYYRDHEDQDHLKPQIIHSLASAEYYCLALANIYADPNYNSLNHHGIVQVLMRKGIYLAEPPDTALTETVLVQTAPIKMSAHMSVIEGLMALYIKEVLIPEKIVEVVRRFSPPLLPEEVPGNAEEAALFWINKCCIKMRHRIEEELGTCRTPDDPDATPVPVRAPSVPILEDLCDMSDGCCLGAVLSLYCPEHLHWQDVCLNDPMSLADSLYNLQLVQHFCATKLPHDVCFLSLEDLLYVHPSIRPNVLAFVADLLFLFEIRPAKCVRRPGVKADRGDASFALEAPRRPSQNGGGSGEPAGAPSMKAVRAFQQAWSPIPDLRSSVSLGASASSLPDINRISPRSSNGGSRLQRQLSAKHRASPLRRTSSATLADGEDSGPGSCTASAEHRLHSDEDEELLRYLPTGQETPTKTGSSTQPSPVRRDTFVKGDGAAQVEQHGRLKRINERVAADVRHEDEEEDVVRGSSRRSSEASIEAPKSDVGPSRWAQSLSENGYYEDEEPYSLGPYPSQQNHADGGGGHEGFSRQSSGLEDYYNQLANDAESMRLQQQQQRKDAEEGPAGTTSFAQLSRHRDSNASSGGGASINIVYMHHDKEGRTQEGTPSKRAPGRSQAQDAERRGASLTTTWQEQYSSRNESPQPDSGHATPTEGAESPLAAQLYNVRLKLEERRRKIEQDKRRLELMWKKQRQRMGKVAFLQAVSKGSAAGTPDSGTGKDELETPSEPPTPPQAPPVERQPSLQEIEEDLDSVRRKWLESAPASESELEDSMSLEQFQTSIEELNTNLADLQADIARLSQQEMIHRMMEKGVQGAHEAAAEPQQFFLHGQHSPHKQVHIPQPPVWHNPAYPQQYPRSVWGEPVPPQFPHQPSESARRGQWGQPVPVWPGRPSSVEPHHPYEQRPSSTVPFHPQQGFSLHQAYPYPPMYQNGPVDGAQYPFQQYVGAQGVHFPFTSPPGSLPPMQMAPSPPYRHHEMPQRAPQYPDSHRPQESSAPPQQQQQEEFSRRPPAEQQPPNKPVIGRTFRVSKPKVLSPSSAAAPQVEEEASKGEGDNGKGFYISFDDAQPRKPKPRLRPKQVKQQAGRGREAPKEGGDTWATSPGSEPSSRAASGRPSPTKSDHQDEPDKQMPPVQETPLQRPKDVSGVGFVIGADLVNPDPESENEMARRKEMIMMMSLRRRAEQEEQRLRKEQDYARKREQERMKREMQEKKKEEEKLRRQAILEQYRQRKAQEEAEKEGLAPPGAAAGRDAASGRTNTLTKPKHRSASASRPRPKSIHVGLGGHESLPFASLDSDARNSHLNVAGTDYSDDTESLRNSASSRSTSSGGQSFVISRHPSSPSQAPVPKGRAGPPSDGASDTGSTISSTIATEYTGPKLFVKPTAKSNRGIILNAINTVLAGAVNADTKKKVLEVINNSDSKHFLILFRDAGCQFRAIYSYNPDRDEVLKMYGVGPKAVSDNMMDRFYKYNSGGKCFSQVQTKHLTVTIDAFTIHNNLWSGKKVVPPKRDFF